MIGTSLGPYKIIEQIGAGGMGEVYLGEDTRLGRKVAIKVLPAEFASDPERLARFEQEARAAAALNHPHIAVVHDIGSEPSESGAETHFMVQEYLEGQSLRERLDKGALPLGTALDLATEVGEALVAAHKAGIIHRDLKPDNVFVTEEGHAKVLDFGLAKLTEIAAAPSGELSHSPTMLGTVAGQVMGTAGYMAPEQVNGEEIDHRADLFAFGCVLYGMVTGRQAFSGKNVHDTLGRILDADPPPVHEANEKLPLKLQWIIDKALAKEPVRRYQHADDLVVDLHALATEVEAGTAQRARAETTAAPGLPGVGWSRTTRAVAVAIAALAVIAGGLTGWRLTRPAPGLPWALEVEVPEGLATVGGGGNLIAISPDARHIVYVAGTGYDTYLVHRPTDQFVGTPIPGTEGARRPFFSPDSQWVGFSAEGNLKKVSIEGSAPFTLCVGCVGVIGAAATWSPEGDSIIFAGGSLWRVSAAGGEARVVAEPDPELGRYSRPAFLPDGRAVLVEVRRGSNSELEDGAVGVLDLETGKAEILVKPGTDPDYAASGHIVFARGNSLYAVSFDAGRRTSLGEPTPVLQGVHVFSGGAAQYSFSADGTLAYKPGVVQTRSDRRLVWVDREGNTTPFSEKLRAFDGLSLSPDGRRLAVQIEGDDGDDIWIFDEARDNSSQLTFGGGSNPVWSSDGEWVAFSLSRDETYSIYREFPGVGGRDAEPLVTASNPVIPLDTSPDDELLLYLELDSETNWDIKVMPLAEEDRTPSAFLPTPAVEGSAVFSPDGNWVAYRTNETGGNEIWVAEYPGPGRREQVSNNGGAAVVWSRDSGELFYVDDNQQMMVVEIATEPGLDIGGPRPLFSTEDRFRVGPSGYDATADGQRFIMVEAAVAEVERDRVNIVLNWFEELERLVPVRQ